MVPEAASDCLNYQIIRSKRKTLSLQIDNEARLVVRAPMRMPERDIAAFVTKKKRWIAEKQLLVLAHREKYDPIEIKTGEVLPFLGTNYTLRLRSVAETGLSGSTIVIPENAVKEDLITWYRHEARKVLTERADHFAELVGVSYTALKISGARTRWGSCSSKNSISFTWRLVMCPPAVVDYIVVHELCHIIQKNHSRDFWAEVEAVLPDHREQKEWLKNNRRLMDIL